MTRAVLAFVLGCFLAGVPGNPTYETRLLAAIREAATLDRVPDKTARQRRRAAELNEIFERDMRMRDGDGPDWPGPR